MPTHAQLQAEPYWGREVVTPELSWLGDELCRRTGQPRTAFGHKGNELHLDGGHRSQEWILNSRYCTNRSYTFQSGLTATQARHIAAADYVPEKWGTAENRRRMVEQTKRLTSAMKAGQLPGVREVIGTLDGKTVTGTRADGSTFKSDSSHLDHWHLTFDRRRMGDRSLMERIVAVALGEDDDDMFCRKGDRGPKVEFLQRMLKIAGFDPGPIDGVYEAKTAAALLACRKSVGSAVTNGDDFTPAAAEHLFRAHAIKVAGGKGEKGPKGDKGDPGEPGTVDEGQVVDAIAGLLTQLRQTLAARS